MAVRVDAFAESIQKYGEELCGDRVEIIRNETGITALLVDGMGGGVKANILTSFTVKMALSMLDRGEAVERIADIIVEFQQAGRQENSGRIGFTLLQANSNGTVCVAQADTPDIILLRRGKSVHMEAITKMFQGRKIRTGVISSKQADTIVAVGSGMLKAGTGRNLKKGFHLSHLTAYLENAYQSERSSKDLTRLLLAAGNSLYRNKPRMDLSALVLRISNCDDKPVQKIRMMEQVENAL